MQSSLLSWVQNSVKIAEHDASSITRDQVMDLYGSRRPFILKNANIGRCVESWQNPEYMRNATDKRVSVHAATSNRLSFLSGAQKNYEFETLEWSDFIDSIYGGEDQDRFIYLRSIGNNPRKQPSDIPSSFPILSADFELPFAVAQLLYSQCTDENNQYTLSQIKSESDKYFSSVLRISMPKVHIWTHYDVMDNVLVQVTGKKFVTIFPPSEAESLYMSHKPNESSSPVVDIFYPYSGPFDSQPRLALDSTENPKEKYPKFWSDALPNAMTCVIEPGDILFIPGLWFHNIYALEDSTGLSTGLSVPSISINVFWRNLNLVEYDRKDLYGNKDLSKACEAYSLVEKACRLIKEIDIEHEHSDFRSFYMNKLTQLILEHKK